MTAERVAIRPCPEASCSGLLRSSVHALAMRCACDTCGKEFFVAYIGMTIPWEEASPVLRQIALDAIVEIAYWKKRFDKVTKGRRLDNIVAVDVQQKRDNALARAEATHKRLLPKPSKKEERPKSVDAMLDGLDKKQKKGT